MHIVYKDPSMFRIFAPRVTYMGPIFAFISWVARDTIKEILEHDFFGFGNYLSSSSLGWPCIHEILAAKEDHQALMRDQFHMQWWLQTSIEDEYQLPNRDNILEIKDSATTTMCASGSELVILARNPE